MAAKQFDLASIKLLSSDKAVYEPSDVSLSFHVLLNTVLPRGLQRCWHAQTYFKEKWGMRLMNASLQDSFALVDVLAAFLSKSGFAPKL